MGSGSQSQPPVVYICDECAESVVMAFRGNGGAAKRTPRDHPRRIDGYHFKASFHPIWEDIAERVVERARALGLKEVNWSDLRPVTESFELSGTRWFGLSSGGLKYDILSFRSDLRGQVVHVSAVTQEDARVCFGVTNRQGLTATLGKPMAVEQATGVWLDGGSLVMQSTKKGRYRSPLLVLVKCDMWAALDDALKRLSGTAHEDIRRPTWAPAFSGTWKRGRDRCFGRFLGPGLIALFSVTACRLEDAPSRR